MNRRNSPSQSTFLACSAAQSRYPLTFQPEAALSVFRVPSASRFTWTEASAMTIRLNTTRFARRGTIPASRISRGTSSRFSSGAFGS